MIKPSFDDLIKSSFRSILKNKSRTVLTSLGIIIGVTSVILLTSIGNGLKAYITKEFESLGSDLVYVAPGKIFNDKGGFNNQEMVTSLSFDQKDITDLKRALPINTPVLPANQTSSEIKYGNQKKNATIVGTSFDYGIYRNLIPKKVGRWFTKEEDEKKSSVAVVGNKLAADLFGSQNPINKKIVVSGRNFKIVGVMDKFGSTMGGPSLDEYLFIPINTCFSMVGNQKIQVLNIKALDKSQIESDKTIIKKTLSKRYKEKDSFSVFDSSQVLSSINSILNILTLGLTGIAAISLVVGGIGIMNIMLVSVTERTKEIGLRKAIGAYPRAILVQFLIEAIILSCLGGLVGIILGTLGTLAINPFFPAKVTLSSVLIAFGVSSAVGIIFGVAPARKASKLSPIEALRYE